MQVYGALLFLAFSFFLGLVFFVLNQAFFNFFFNLLYKEEILQWFTHLIPQCIVCKFDCELIVIYCGLHTCITIWCWIICECYYQHRCLLSTHTLIVNRWNVKSDGKHNKLFVCGFFVVVFFFFFGGGGRGRIWGDFLVSFRCYFTVCCDMLVLHCAVRAIVNRKYYHYWRGKCDWVVLRKDSVTRPFPVPPPPCFLPPPPSLPLSPFHSLPVPSSRMVASMSAVYFFK